MLRRLAAAGFILTVLLIVGPVPARAQCASATASCLTAQDVMDVVRAAVTAVSGDMVVGVADRGGNPLAVFVKGTPPATVVGNFGNPNVPSQDQAIGLARTGAFFSNDQAPLSSRTVRFISGIHFPPGVTNKPPAALYGIENTNRGCSFNIAFNAGVPNIPRATSVVNAGNCQAGDVTACGTGIVTGKADVFDSNPGAVNGGGVPIFKNGRVVGGVGVTGLPLDQAEFAAFVGSLGFSPLFGPRPAEPGVVVLDGVTLPFVKNTGRPGGTVPGTFPGVTFVLGPVASPYGAVGPPSGYLVGPTASAVNPQLSAAAVNTIIQRAVSQASRTRAAIRLPLGEATRMVIAVGDTAGTLLGLFRMPDATIFSIDVAVAKARNAAYYSSPTRDARDMPGFPRGFAMTARTLGFGAMPLYPPGIDGTAPGPFFGDYTRDVATPCAQGFQPVNANQSGVVFFPGSIGLYNGTTLIGGLGVSGDGVEQDDLVTAAGAGCPGCPFSFVAPPEIRADRVIIGGVRLPFFKFPRNPETQ
ncbi:MAG TPA: heme-binding protein [Methylomirabilota bacterium]|nr:heme-binding protein [Methylomirabilota bacterium]